MMKSVSVALFALTALSACDETAMDTGTAGVPAVGSASDLSSFQGAKAGQSEMGIQALGYEATRVQGLTTYWYNASTNRCYVIVTSDGRYSSVTPSDEC